MLKYIYKLGHIPQLGRAELGALLGVSYKQIEVNSDFAFSSSFIPANQTGSIVWSGQILQEISENLLTWTDLKPYILSQSGQFKAKMVKRLGLVLPKQCKPWQQEIISELKSVGFKGVNLVFGLENFTFGNYRSIKNWLIACPQKSSILLIDLLDMSNQEFWSNLDMRLPQRDMKRGIINLKLARTLVNLAQSKQIWDPFVGQGRLLIAGMDRVEKSAGSDIDEACLPECVDNMQYAQHFWNKFGHRVLGKTSNEIISDEKNQPGNLGNLGKTEESENKDSQKEESEKLQNPENTLQTKDELKTQSYSELLELFQLDANKLKDVPFLTKNWAMVTEGYLGPTLSNKANKQESEKELDILVNMWISVFQQSVEIGLTKAIVCLPHFPVISERVYQDILYEFSSIKNVKLEPLSDSGFILYSREKSRVGHLIFSVIFE